MFSWWKQFASWFGRPGHSAAAPQSSAAGIRTQDLIGQWRLVTVAGAPPSSLNIRSQQVRIVKDGTWVSTAEMEGKFAGLRIEIGGNWSLADGVVDYTAGENAGRSQVKLASGRLILDPDFSIREGGTKAVVGEYER